MRITFCMFGGLGELSMIAAFERMGHQVSRFDDYTKNHDYDKEYMHKLIAHMEKVDCDVVFSINFLPIVSKVSKIFRKTYISWVYDCPELHLYSDAISNENNRIFVFDKLQYEEISARAPKNVFYMPLASEPMKQLPSEEEQEMYQSDVCFIGSLYNEKDRRYDEIARLPVYLKGYVDGLVSAQLNVFGYNFIKDSLSDEMVQSFKEHLQWELIKGYECDDRTVLADMYIGSYCSAVERRVTLKNLAARFPVAIYTDSDVSDLQGVENRGLADSISMMPKIFYCSKINLNITSKTIQSGISLRVFDVLANQGFLITNHQPELYDYFTPGEDFVVYESQEDLLQKVEYYLTHEEERLAIAKHGYETLRTYHTYDMRLKDILEIAL